MLRLCLSLGPGIHYRLTIAQADLQMGSLWLRQVALLLGKAENLEVICSLEDFPNLCTHSLRMYLVFCLWSELVNMVVH